MFKKSSQKWSQKGVPKKHSCCLKKTRSLIRSFPVISLVAYRERFTYDEYSRRALEKGCWEGREQAIPISPFLGVKNVSQEALVLSEKTRSLIRSFPVVSLVAYRERFTYDEYSRRALEKGGWEGREQAIPISPFLGVKNMSQKCGFI